MAISSLFLNRRGREKKDPSSSSELFPVSSPHQQEPVCSRQISLFALRVTADSAGVASGTLISTTTPSTLENLFFSVVLVVKNPPANAGDVRDAGLIPGKTPWRKQWQPTPVFLPGESLGQRSLAGHSP